MEKTIRSQQKKLLHATKSRNDDYMTFGWYLIKIASLYSCYKIQKQHQNQLWAWQFHKLNQAVAY